MGEVNEITVDPAGLRRAKNTRKGALPVHRTSFNK